MLEVDDAALDILEARLTNLEKLVYGNNRVLPSQSSPMIDSLLSVNTLLNAAANGKTSINSVFKRLPELNRDLADSAFEPGAETERKLQKILSMEQEYLNNVAMLEKLQHLDSALDAGRLRSVLELKPQLSALVDDYAVACANFDDRRAGDVLATWHGLVNEVNKALISANNALAEAEIKKLGLNKKKSLDD